MRAGARCPSLDKRTKAPGSALGPPHVSVRAGAKPAPGTAAGDSGACDHYAGPGLTGARRAAESAAAASSSSSSSSLDKMAATGTAAPAPPARAPALHPCRSRGAAAPTAGSPRTALPPTAQAALARRERRGDAGGPQARARVAPASPPPRRADGVGAGAPAPLRNAGYAGRAAELRRLPRAVRRPEGHRSSPETLGRTPPPPAAAAPSSSGCLRGAGARPPFRRAHRPRLPAGTAGSRRCRSHHFGSSVAGEQNKQPYRRRRRRRRRQRTDVTAHAARAVTRCRRPACAPETVPGESELKRAGGREG
nr:uncharacterized protein LOC115865554 [Globicephala melas]